MSSYTNPFLGRMSESATSDQEFIQLFSPKILERIPNEAFQGALHIFRSPPGGGKTTLLRAFTPSSLRAIWNARNLAEQKETFQNLVDRDIFDSEEGPQLLGVLLTCASGYADLPPGASTENEGLFRALLDCRIVMRSLRNLAIMLGRSSVEKLDDISIEYSEVAKDLKSIPLLTTANEIVKWAEEREHSVYSQLDSLVAHSDSTMPKHVRFEGVIWLQEVKFIRNGKEIVPKRLLMIDDLHKLRQKQRGLLIDELVTIRSSTPIWLAERNIALKEELLSQGAREGRDVKAYALEEIWSSSQGKSQFNNYAQNILERRFQTQSIIPSKSFLYCLSQELQNSDIQDELHLGIDKFFSDMNEFRNNDQYSEWFKQADKLAIISDYDTFIRLLSIKILIYRNEGKRQLSLEFIPLTQDEFESRDSANVKSAAEIFAHEEFKIPYYYGIDKLCTLSSNNIEELLALASELYEGLIAKKVMRRSEYILSAKEQEQYIKDVAKKKRLFIPKTHTHGTRAQHLLDNIGYFCKEKTFQQNAPYAPGVTGFRLSHNELSSLQSKKGSSEDYATLSSVLSECVAENLLILHKSSETTSRAGGTVFYLNRTLCAYFDLPLQKGGWQDIRINELLKWMSRPGIQKPKTNL